ncbi:MAG: hypothetical protein ACREMG_05565, partial [Gemmatimonadales bacterium]
EIMSLGVIQQNIGRRPIVWASTAGKSHAGLSDYVVQRGLGFQLLTARPDTTSPALDLHRLAGVPLDLPTTERLLWETYRYGGLLEGGATELESTSAGVAGSLSLPYIQLVYAYRARGETEKLRQAFERAAALSPNPDLRAGLGALLDQPVDPAGGAP